MSTATTPSLLTRVQTHHLLWPVVTLVLAGRFWAAASADPRISSGFRQIAADNLRKIGL